MSVPKGAEDHGLAGLPARWPVLVTFDEAATSDSSSCCGEMPGPGSPEPGENGPGGGDVGAVLSPCIAPGTVSNTPYNHYTMLGSVENLFGLSHLGYAGLPGETYFGSDIFNRSCGPPPTGGPGAAPTVHAPPLASASGTSSRSRCAGAEAAPTPCRCRCARSPRARGQWRTLLAATHETHLTFIGALGATYRFRVQADRGPFATGACSTPPRSSPASITAGSSMWGGLVALEGLAIASRTG
jgi:hypothetical protein